MKTLQKTKLALVALVLTILAASCTSSGQYTPLSSDETVTGTIQTVFEVSSIFFFRKRTGSNAISIEAYKHLLEAAERKYPNSIIDVRDVSWFSKPHNPKTATIIEIYAIGKVIRDDSDKTDNFTVVE